LETSRARINAEEEAIVLGTVGRTEQVVRFETAKFHPFNKSSSQTEQVVRFCLKEDFDEDKDE